MIVFNKYEAKAVLVNEHVVSQEKIHRKIIIHTMNIHIVALNKTKLVIMKVKYLLTYWIKQQHITITNKRLLFLTDLLHIYKSIGLYERFMALYRFDFNCKDDKHPNKSMNPQNLLKMVIS